MVVVVVVLEVTHLQQCSSCTGGDSSGCGVLICF